VQFGTNHLGHFALTAGLLPLLRATSGARVISLSSIVARGGKLNFDDPNWVKSYHPMQAYGQSKLACLMFGLELQRRSAAAGWGITSITAHPGVSRTDLINNGMGAVSFGGFIRKTLPFLFQPIEMGALPILFAATSPQAQAGGYYGPDKLNELRGHPTTAKIPAQALNVADATRLWDLSAQMTKLNIA
jgi:NAD(P)-dependent dehydrogenase (short-subunit alcohol dehydrogenase family)